ncbi:MAG: hypothetical protein ACLQA5_21185 [Solirubrobacteraceae bacterium]
MERGSGSTWRAAGERGAWLGLGMERTPVPDVARVVPLIYERLL